MAVTGCDLSSAEQRVDEQGTIVAGGRGGEGSLRALRACSGLGRINLRNTVAV